MLLRGQIKYNHDLAKYTSWRIGGPARVFYQPTDLEDLKNYLITLSHKEKNAKIVLLGGATNVLINSAGIDATVIYLRNCLTKLTILDNNLIRVEAGFITSNFAKYSTDLGMIDSAFLAGIPGTIGGAVAMNAGAHGNNIWNHIVAVETINRAGEIKIRKANEFKAGYREVLGFDKNNEWFVAVHLTFNRDDVTKAKNRVTELLAKRKASQPLDKFTCGSVFRNPPNNFAAKLIEECGLKGFKIGAAAVSQKHANFIVNEGNATSDDVQKLMQKIITEVAKKTGINLIPEVHVYF